MILRFLYLVARLTPIRQLLRILEFYYRPVLRWKQSRSWSWIAAYLTVPTATISVGTTLNILAGTDPASTAAPLIVTGAFYGSIILVYLVERLSKWRGLRFIRAADRRRRLAGGHVDPLEECHR